MSIDINAPAPTSVSHRHDHVRPNPSNPLVTIKRSNINNNSTKSFSVDGEANGAAAAVSSSSSVSNSQSTQPFNPLVPLDPRGEPSKGGKLTDINAPTPVKASLPLPERFKQPELWADKASPQHPLYRTSGQTYGYRPPAIQEMPNKYFGNSHTFTNTFAGGMHRDFGLNTSIQRNKVGVKEEFGYY